MEAMEIDNFWQDKRVFVTGGSGLVGGWLLQKLISLGADVVALVRDWVPHSRLVKEKLFDSVTLVRGDLSDCRFLERVLAEYEIKVVFHLAAQTIVPIANRNPLSTFESNIAGTWNLLEACRLCGIIDSIVVASSDKAYGDAPVLPYREDMPLQAIYPYDVSKACTDMIAISYAKSFSLPVSVTRCGNFFGGGDLNWNRIIPGTIRSIIRGQSPIIRSDGSLVRDYIYVEDAVSAYLTLSRAIVNNPEIAGQAFNFSNKTQVDTIELVNIICKKCNSSLEPVVQGVNNGEIQAQYLDSNKANTLLSWQPKFGLDEGLEKTINWYKEYFHHAELSNMSK